jgi:S1-C subfamily serine protease
VIVAIDGVPVTDADTLVRIVTTRLEPGRSASFLVIRGGRRRTVVVTLGARRPG